MPTHNPARPTDALYKKDTNSGTIKIHVYSVLLEFFFHCLDQNFCLLSITHIKHKVKCIAGYCWNLLVFYMSVLFL